jgi:hypothetical protein
MHAQDARTIVGILRRQGIHMYTSPSVVLVYPVALMPVVPMYADVGVPELPRALHRVAQRGGGAADQLLAARLTAPHTSAPRYRRGLFAVLRPGSARLAGGGCITTRSLCARMPRCRHSLVRPSLCLG